MIVPKILIVVPVIFVEREKNKGDFLLFSCRRSREDGDGRCPCFFYFQAFFLLPSFRKIWRERRRRRSAGKGLLKEGSQGKTKKREVNYFSLVSCYFKYTIIIFVIKKNTK